MQSDVSAGAPSFSPSALSLRPSPLLPTPPLKYEFRGAQEAAAGPTDRPDMSNMRNPAADRVPCGGPFFPEPLRAPMRPPFEYEQYGPGPYRLEVDANNSKSRVETQIGIRIRLSHLPNGVTKLHLPKHTISKTKLWAKPAAVPSPDMLELHTVLVCTSAMQVHKQKMAALQRAQRAAQAALSNPNPVADGEGEELKPQDGGDVKICEQCIGRERKRAGRKKLKNPEDELAWIKDEARRVIVFNTHEVKDWTLQNPAESASRPFFQVEAPMRIACYCRHHAEKLGFQIIFTLTDHRGQIIAQTLSPSIMITDDHKNTSPKPVPGARVRKLSPTRRDVPAQGAPGMAPSLESSPSLDLQSGRRGSAGSMPIAAVPADQLQPPLAAPPHRSISRPASPSLPGGPAKKRRPNSKPAKIPSDLTMTRLETALPSGSRPHKSSASAGPLTPATSPFPPTPPAVIPPASDMPVFGSTAAPSEPFANAFGNNSHAGGSSSKLLFPSLNRTSSSLANFAMHTAPGTSRPSPACSPNASRPATNGQARPPQAQAQPAIFKVIPSEGPVAGGVEVTLMGQGFYNGMHVMFGDKQAPATTFWSSESLVCLLPPSETAGMVPVTLKEQTLQSQNLAPQWFRYVDDSEQQLLRTALMILGNKMTGGYEDVADFARRIIKEAANGYSMGSSEMPNGEGTQGRAMDNFEGHLLKLLELMDISNTNRKPRLNLRRSTGHTMLHLACKMGLHRFVAGLLARGANTDLRDKGGYTALHMAALNNHLGIVRMLINNGADPTLRTLSGLTAADLAKSREVLQTILRFELHRQSQGGSSRHSRASSVASLKSLRTQMPLSRAVSDTTSTDEPRSEHESMDGSDAFSEDVSEGPAGGEPSGLRMRRGRSTANTPRERSPARARRRDSDGSSALNLPAAAMAAIKEQVAAQFQQLQQMMVPGLQYLPQFPQLSQFPYLPQIPNMPPLPDYQTAVLQRIATMIGGARPEADGEQPPTKVGEGRWQYPSSLPTDAAQVVPPPAYDELFPQRGGSGDLETKQASAAQAAAEAEADAKCATLYDQPATSSAAAQSRGGRTATGVEEDGAREEDAGPKELPALLQIGRKSAITREQQATLRRAHAENLRRQSWDRNLFFIWVCDPLFHSLPLFTSAAMYAY